MNKKKGKKTQQGEQDKQQSQGPPQQQKQQPQGSSQQQKQPSGKGPSQQQRQQPQEPPQQQKQQPQGPPQQQKQQPQGPPQKQKQQPQGPPQQQKQQPQGPPQQQRQQRQGPPQQQKQQPQGPPQKQKQQPQGPPQQQPSAWGPPQQQRQQPQGPQQQRQQPQEPPQQQPSAWGPPQEQRQQPQGPPQQQKQQPQGPPQQQPSAWGPPQQQRQQPQGPPQQQPSAWGPPQQQRQQPQGPPQQQKQQPQGPPQQQPSAWGPPQQQRQQPQGPQQQRQQPQGPPQQQPSAWGPPQQQWQQPQGPPQQQSSARGPPQQLPSGHAQKQRQQSQGQSSVQGTPQKQEQSPDKKIGIYNEFCRRIKADSKPGRKIIVATNFFPIIIKNYDITIYHYDVVFVPERPKHLLRPGWNKFCSEHLGGCITAFDGSKNAYSSRQLINTNSLSKTVVVTNPENDRDKEFIITIKEVRRLSFANFKNYKEKVQQRTEIKVLPEAELSVLEIILKSWAANNLVESRRTYFPLERDIQSPTELSSKTCMRNGFFQSAVLGYQLYLNFDIAHKPFYKSTTLLEILKSFNRSNFIDFETFIRRVKISYEIPKNPDSRRVFTVNQLKDDAVKQKFQKEDGSEISVYDYFLREKNYELKYPELPLLWVGSRQKTIYIPMELCRIEPDQVYRIKTDSQETRVMTRKATSNARQRRKDTETNFRYANFRNEFMKEFGISVSEKMEEVPARILDPPSLKTTVPIRVNKGEWRSSTFLEPKDLRKWCILNLSRTSQQNLIDLQNLIKSKGRQFKMGIEDPTLNPIDLDDTSIAKLKAKFSKLKHMDLIFVIIPEKKKGVYANVKTITELSEGILTQCIKDGTVSQDSSKISKTIENILLKVNTKLGGKNHCLGPGWVPRCLEGYVMIVGADVTHPSPGSQIPSVAAVAVSCDPRAFQYGMTTRVQRGEIIQNLDEIVKDHLSNFYKLHKRYPEKIIVFRDGVSEGEMGTVLKEELKAIRNACGNLCSPLITFIVVQKRHHTRFYPTSERDEEGRNFNVPVGTCVDSDVVHPRDLEFYLLSHSAGLGTARPTKYRLLYDDNRLTDNEVQTMAYYLCHMFSRCNKSVSYPSPTYNAHLAAFRGRTYLEGLNIGSADDLAEIQRRMTDNISQRFPMFFV